MEILKEREGTAAGVPAEEELALINRFARTPLRAEEVYTFHLRLCDNEVDRDWERFDDGGAGRTLGELFLGKSGIFDHQWSAQGQTARIYRTQVVREPAPQVTAAGDGYCWLKAWAYLLRTEKNAGPDRGDRGGHQEGGQRGVQRGPAGVLRLRRGGGRLLPHAGAAATGSSCASRSCADPTDAYEWSFVAVPAQRQAGVLKRYGREDARGRHSCSSQAALGRKYLRASCGGRWCAWPCWRTTALDGGTLAKPRRSSWRSRSCWSSSGSTRARWPGGFRRRPAAAGRAAGPRGRRDSVSESERARDKGGRT